jgi:type IV pilus assembly protein PilN
MYSLDINFLKDRSEQKQVKFNQFPKTRLAIGNQTPLYLGLAVGVVLPTIVGAGWLFLQSQNAQLENKVAAIDAELNRLGLQEENLKKIQEQTGQIQAETRALATVFNQIRPWSAILQDIRDRIPKSVQIQSVKQIAASTAPQPATQANSNSTANQPAQPTSNLAGGIEISGSARSFNDVNDFLLTLKQSAFLQSSETKIIKAELTENPATNGKVKLPSVVQYTIQSNLSNVPAANILRELERKGTFGLVTRIRTLQQRGVIQP